MNPAIALISVLVKERPNMRIGSRCRRRGFMALRNHIIDHTSPIHNIIPNIALSKGPRPIAIAIAEWVTSRLVLGRVLIKLGLSTVGQIYGIR